MCFQVKPLIILEAIEMSSKFSSSHFSRTNGSAVEYLSNLIEIDEPTATVWWHISPTQPDYPGTKIPRSFEVSTPSESFWTHGNATEHMYDAVSSLKNDPMLKILIQICFLSSYSTITARHSSGQQKVEFDMEDS